MYLLGNRLHFLENLVTKFDNISCFCLLGKDFFDTRNGQVLADLNFAPRSSSANPKTEVSLLGRQSPQIVNLWINLVVCNADKFNSSFFFTIQLFKDRIHPRGLPASKQRRHNLSLAIVRLRCGSNYCLLHQW